MGAARPGSFDVRASWRCARSPTYASVPAPPPLAVRPLAPIASTCRLSRTFAFEGSSASRSCRWPSCVPSLDRQLLSAHRLHEAAVKSSTVSMPLFVATTTSALHRAPLSSARACVRRARALFAAVDVVVVPPLAAPAVAIALPAAPIVTQTRRHQHQLHVFTQVCHLRNLPCSVDLDVDLGRPLQSDQSGEGQLRVKTSCRHLDDTRLRSPHAGHDLGRRGRAEHRRARVHLPSARGSRGPVGALAARTRSSSSAATRSSSCCSTSGCPGIDGFEVCRQIGGDGAGDHADRARRGGRPRRRPRARRRRLRHQAVLAARAGRAGQGRAPPSRRAAAAGRRIADRSRDGRRAAREVHVDGRRGRCSPSASSICSITSSCAPGRW